MSTKRTRDISHATFEFSAHSLAVDMIRQSRLLTILKLYSAFIFCLFSTKIVSKMLKNFFDNEYYEIIMPFDRIRLNRQKSK